MGGSNRVVTQCWAAVFVCVLSGAARAQTNSSDKAAADALFDAARDLMKQQRYAEACPKFADSERLDPGTGTLLNLGRCYALNGQTASAWTTYREAAARARAEGQAEREALAREEAAKLEPKLTRVVIQVSEEARAAGVTVLRDGEELPKTLWGVPTPMDPGEHTMEATAPGKAPRTATFRVEGEGATVSVVVPPLSDRTPAPPTDPSPVAPVVAPASVPTPQNAAAQPTDSRPASHSTDAGSTQKILGYAAGGLGVAGVVVGALIARQGLAQNQDAEDICRGIETMCPPEDIAHHDDLTRTAKNNFTRATIAFGVGGALLATGAILLLTAGPGTEQPAQTALSAWAGPGGGCVQVSGSF